MKFVCDRCQTKYSIADDKVRGKVLKVRCKTCQNVITVREPGARPSVGGLAPVRPSQRPPSAAVPVLSTQGERDEQSERTSIAPAPAGFMADLVPGRRATPPPPPPLGDGIEWFLALDGAQQGPFPRKVLVDRLLALPKDADVHVWNDGMAGWKPPRDVPDVARDLLARRPPVVPVRPPFPRTTPSPPVPPMAARRGPTQPLTSGVGAKLPAPTASQSHAHAVPVPHAHGEDPASQLTPPPAAPGKPKRKNGVGGHASSPVVAFPGVESDAMSALNLGARARAPSGPLRLMEVAEATSWSGAGRVSEGRHRGTKMAVGLLALVGVMIVIFTLNATKKSTAVTPLPTAKGGLDSETFGKLAETVSKEKKEPPTVHPTIIPEPPVATGPETRGGGKGIRGHLAARGGRPVASHVGTSPPPSTGGAAVAPAEDANATRFRETGGRTVAPTASVANRPAPSQGEISRVIANNKAGIKTCYQRALLRDSSLTHGKIVVGVSIGISGRVKSVRVDGPTAFRALEPCIKEMLSRWVFPQSYEEYGTEFSYVFQGNE